MREIILIRHLATQGNKERRYIGRTDEPIMKETANIGPQNEEITELYVSPMLRCRQTAQILYPENEQKIVNGLRECDFGIFEGRTAEEMSGMVEYSAWLETGCEGEIPGGDSVKEFKERSCRAFLEIAERAGNIAAIVTHGGVIMAVLERYGYPKKEFYDYHVKNGGMIRRQWKDRLLI